MLIAVSCINAIDILTNLEDPPPPISFSLNIIKYFHVTVDNQISIQHSSHLVFVQ